MKQHSISIRQLLVNLYLDYVYVFHILQFLFFFENAKTPLKKLIFLQLFLLEITFINIIKKFKLVED